MVRVRFAPSPTGYLHVGGMRTALFNKLFALNKNGKFILRIEDTDKKRSQSIYLEQILEDLKWLGLDWDEGPFHQSKRLARYQEHAERLITKKQAHRDGRAVIFKIPPEMVAFNDLVHGKIESDNSLLGGELVLIKSDGLPTYNFACVVDDAELEITHVIRGDDHISNTPKQVALYQALGFELPEFAHIPLILAEDKSPLSKRRGAKPISYYRQAGYLPEAVLNFLALLGWSAGGNREILSRRELISLFSLGRIVKTQSVFDEKKFEWLNGQYIKGTPTERLVEALLPRLKAKKFIADELDRAWLSELVKLYQGRIKTLDDFLTQCEFFFAAKLKFDPEAKAKFLNRPELVKPLQLASERLSSLEDFSPAGLEACCRQLIAELKIKGGELIHPLRVATTGKSVSAGVFEVLALLGKDKVLQRLQQAVSDLKRL